MKYTISLALILLLFSACEPIEEESDITVDTAYTPNAVNTCNLSEETTLGCFGSGLEFGDNEKLDEGYWSLYAKRDTNLVYYNTYLFSYQFSGNGYAQTLNKPQNYYVLSWGIDRDGSKITTDLEGTITYVGIFDSDPSCYKVKLSTFGNEELKMCHDKRVDGLKNSLGYYAKEITFGNYTYGDYSVVGTWKVTNYDDGSTVATHMLDANGSAKEGGIWGVSEDGKVLHVNEASYLVNQYLDNNCLICFNTNGSRTTPLKLCKVAP